MENPPPPHGHTTGGSAEFRVQAQTKHTYVHTNTRGRSQATLGLLYLKEFIHPSSHACRGCGRPSGLLGGPASHEPLLRAASTTESKHGMGGGRKGAEGRCLRT